MMNVTAESNKRSFLVIARVGDASLHPSWLEPQEFRSFDLCLCYAGDQTGRYSGDCEYYMEAQGAKWPGMKDIVRQLGEDLDRYEAVWAADERLETNAFTITQMFHIFADQELWLAQPALTEDSSPCGSVPRHHPDYILRYIRLLEWTAPVFTPEVLKACVSAIDAHSAGTGFQFLWPGNLSYPPRKTAVIDVTPVKLLLPEEQAAVNPDGCQEPQDLQEAPMEDMADNNETPGKQLEQEEEPAEEEQPPLFSIRKPGRIRRPVRLRRTRRKSGSKLKVWKNRKPGKWKKKKLYRKLKKAARTSPRALLKPKRKISAAKKRVIAA